MNHPACDVCLKIVDAHEGRNSHLVYEFKHSYLVVGDHQYFSGYCVLLAKEHVREPFEFEEQTQQEMFRELMISAQAIQTAFSPWKMNYSCYGNQVPHVHWHLFPRYESDPLHKQPPFTQSAEFSEYPTTESQAREVAKRIKAAIRS